MSYDVEYVYNTSNTSSNVVGFALVDTSGANAQRNMYSTTYYPVGSKKSLSYEFTTPANINGGTWRLRVYTGYYYNDEGTRVKGEMIFKNIKIIEV
jgi:hypothetical protein